MSGPHPPPLGGGTAHRVVVAPGLGGGALVLPGGRGVREAVRQRDDPGQPGRRGEHQTARTADTSGQRPAWTVRPGLPGNVRAPGRRVGGSHRDQPGDRLPHPPRYRPGPLVCDGLLAAPAHPRPPDRGGARPRRDRCRHERRPPRRLAPGRPRQPDGCPAPLLLRPVRHPRAPRRPAPPRPHPPPALGQHLRGQGDRGRGPGLRRGEDPREARPQETLPATGLRHAHRKAPRPAGVDGRPDGDRGHRRRPAYTSRWGAQHWQKPLTRTTRKTTRHDAAAVAIGRRAQGHPIRRRTAPPPQHRSDAVGHRTVQARPGIPGREGTRPRIPGPRTRSVPPGRGANAGNQNAQHRPGRSAEHETWQQDSLPLSL